MKSLKTFPATAYLLSFFAYASFAQTGDPSLEVALQASPIITASYIFQLLLSLLIVFGLMYIIYKYVLPKINVTSKSRFIEVIDKVGLEPQVGAYILKVGGSAWLVVVSNKNVSLISKIEALPNE